jgi:hypothetical protein
MIKFSQSKTRKRNIEDKFNMEKINIL